MNGLTAALLVWTLISPSGGGHGGRGEIWPTHVACRNEGLEVFYQSCDPLQDFGFSVDQCSKKLQPHLSIRFGIILREDIRELFLDVLLLTKGASVLNFSYPICEDDLPKFSFCGRRKGDLTQEASFKPSQMNCSLPLLPEHRVLFLPQTLSQLEVYLSGHVEQ
nr:lymphocyte antigen 86 isoform X2 [Marmota flaviventris]